MSADYYFFAPTGGRCQTVFRGTLPRRYSIRRSRWDNTLPVKHDFFHHILYNFFIFSTYTLFAILYCALLCVYN